MRRALALAGALVLSSCLQVSWPWAATPTASPSRSPAAVADMTERLLAKPLPVANVFELERSVQGKSGTPAEPFMPVRSSPRSEQAGATGTFWVYDFKAKKNVQARATLRLVTGIAKWWVADGVGYDAAALERSARIFQDRIHPTDVRLFGQEWTPGIDADPHLDVLLAPIPGAAAGYFSAADELPRWVNQFSAEREMIYMNSLAVRPGSDYFHSVLAHELCHMIQYARRAPSVIWFDEGQSQLCERANGYDLGGFDQLFLREPDTQLDTWTDLDQGAAQHYGGVYLFLEFLRARTGGGYALINRLLDKGVRTVEDIDRELRAGGHPPFEEVFADFVAANALIGLPAGPSLRYPADLGLRVPARPAAADRLGPGAKLSASVHPQAARYFDLPRPGRYDVSFSAPSAVRVIPTDPHSGSSFWWSDRNDSLDSTMTRSVDLSAVASATLSFWTWYDIEPDFDYAYVTVSSDGGTSWTTLATEATTTTDPNGSNLGNGLTGTSGGGKHPAWVRQTADLSPYAGRKVLLRFRYVTDQALNKASFAVDDIEIPQIGYRDDAESDNGWDAEGFIRSTNMVRARYLVQVITAGESPRVERRVVEDGKATITVDTGTAPAVLAVSPLVVRRTEPIPIEVSASSR